MKNEEFMFKRLFLASFLIVFTACTAAGSNTTGTGTGSSAQSSLIVQTLSPICVDQVQKFGLIPQQAKDLGVTEAAVCDCGLRRTEAKFTTEPQLLGTILTDRDKQIEILTQLATECSAELLQQALLRKVTPQS
jgi:hypothetical protein